jgi:hypothetical protein
MRLALGSTFAEPIGPPLPRLILDQSFVELRHVLTGRVVPPSDGVGPP